MYFSRSHHIVNYTLPYEHGTFYEEVHKHCVLWTWSLEGHGNYIETF